MNTFLFMERVTKEQMLRIFHSRFLLFLQEAIDRDGPKEWTNRKMASRLGLSENSISALKGGTSLPGADTLYNIAEMFGGTTGQLLGREDFRALPGKPRAIPESKDEDGDGKRRKAQ
jgi:transcriptional regulator with XRE-family HTH domain